MRKEKEHIFFPIKNTVKTIVISKIVCFIKNNKCRKYHNDKYTKRYTDDNSNNWLNE